MSRKNKVEKTDSDSQDFTQESIISWIICSALIIIPLVFKPGIIGISNEPKLLVAALCASSCLIAIGFLHLTSLCPVHIYIKQRKPEQGILALSLILFVFSITSSAWALNKPLVLEKWSEWAIAFLVFILISLFNGNSNASKRVMCGLVIGGALNSGLALIQLLFDLAPDFQRAPPGGTYLNRNFAASYAILCLGPSLFLYLSSAKSSSRLVWITTTLLLSLLIFHSFSRASWASAVVIWCLTITFVYFTKKNAIGEKVSIQPPSFKAVTVFILLFLAGTNINHGKLSPRLLDGFDRLQTAFSYEDESSRQSTESGKLVVSDPVIREGSLATRLKYWRNTLELIKDHPVIGNGFGSFEVVYPPYNNAVHKTPFDTKKIYLKYAHQEFLETMVELGLAGFLVLMALIACFYFALFQRFRDPDSKGLLIAIATIIGMTGFMLNCQASSPLAWPAHKCALAVMAGLFVSSAPRRAIQVPAKFKTFGVIVLLSGSIIGYIYADSYRRVVAGEALYVESASRIATSVYDKEGLQMLIEAARILPNDKQISRSAGGMLKIHKRQETALKYLEKVAVRYPYDFLNNQNLAYLHLQMNDKSEAEKAFDRIYRVVDDDIDALLKLAVLKRTSDLSKSNEILKRAIALEVTSPLAYILLAENAETVNNSGLASDYIKSGNARFPGNSMIKKAARDMNIFLKE